MVVQRSFSSRLVVFATVLLLGVASSVTAQSRPIVMKIANPGPGDPHQHMIAAATLVFQDYVERHSQGRIDVQVFPAFQLGSMPEMMSQVQLGTVQATTVFSAVASQYVPEVDLIYVPFLFSSPEITWRVFDGPMGNRFRDMWLEKGFVPLYMADNGGSRAFGTTRRQIRTPADLRGQRIRIPESRALKILVEALGASAPVITFNELYSSVQTGVVDGFEVPLAVLSFSALNEVIRYASITNHTWDMVFLLVNKAWFNSLPEDLQRILIEGGRHAETVCRGMSEVLAAQQVGVLAEKGVDVYTPTSSQIAQFRQLTQQPVIDYLETQLGEQIVRDFMSAVERAESAARTDTANALRAFGR